jgi:hypothetical protein
MLVVVEAVKNRQVPQEAPEVMVGEVVVEAETEHLEQQTPAVEVEVLVISLTVFNEQAATAVLV